MKRALKWGIGAILLVGLVLLALTVWALGPGNFGRMFIGVGRSYDAIQPTLPSLPSPTSILIFSKTNGYRDDPQIAAANAALENIARERGWSSYTTENAAVFNSKQLDRFDVVVWDSVSGDVLTAPQRAALRKWIEAGGGFVALHGSGGDPSYAWKWYVDDLIGAQFIGHTMDPQFQHAELRVEDLSHPATKHLPQRWPRTDEWYSFSSNPRDRNYHVLVSIDERTYSPLMRLPLAAPKDIRMGSDHPMVWTHCVGQGRAFYSALGHTASSYSEPLHLSMLAGAMAWAGGLEGTGCGESTAGKE